jgi:hypothetical protein
MANIFGGKNENSLYVPMSEVEQEALSRLIEADDLEVVIVGWGILTAPKVTLGDKRLAIQITLNFNAPEVPVSVWYFDLELRTRSGLILHAERHPTMYAGEPLKVHAGTFVDMIWDIAIDRIPPAVVKMLVPGSVGLTSRFTDKDTGEYDPTGGNMKLTVAQREILSQVQKGNKMVRDMDVQKVAKVSGKGNQGVTR